MKYTVINGDGSTEERDDGPSPLLIEAEVRRRFDEEVEKRLGASSSSGAQWLLELRRQQPGFIQPVQLFEAGEWFIRKLGCEDIDEIGVTMAAQGFGLREISNIEVRASFSKALLYVGVCEGADNPARKFANVGEAGIFYAEPRGLTALIARTLRDQLLLLNPVFVIEDEEDKKKVLEPNDFL